jgi:hypothetical protein
MKKLLSIILIISLFDTLQAQEIAIEEPEFTGIILLVKDPNTGEKLEKQKSSNASKADIGAAIFGVSKAKGMNMVKGSSSPVRTAHNENIQFIVKVKENHFDPVDVINIFKMESDSEKDHRLIVTGKVNFNKSSTLDIEFIPFEATKYGESSYLVNISELQPGEYAMTLDGSRDVFNLFGVD